MREGRTKIVYEVGTSIKKPWVTFPKLRVNTSEASLPSLFIMVQNINLGRTKPIVYAICIIVGLA